MPRRSRQRTISPSAFLVPINIRDFGDLEKDPCFGKLFDLTTPECQACGDSELCAVVKAQSLHKERILVERTQGALDVEFSDLKQQQAIKKYFEDCRSSGVGRMLSIKRASLEFKVSKDFIKKMLNGSEH